ncbi:MAG: hypothetical protein IT210_18695 [Armatimonadetes bacterium]|nr:hypothetical protein [Armatimonadota bacterium]
MRSLVLGLGLCLLALSRPGITPPASSGWSVAPSLPVDALCFIQAMSGDPMYARFYAQERAVWQAKLPPEWFAAARSLSVSASSLAWFAARAEAADFDALLALFRNPGPARSARPGAFPPEAAARLRPVLEAAPTVARLLETMQSRGFVASWHREIRPALEDSARSLEQRLRPYDTARLLTAARQFLGESAAPPAPFRIRLIHFGKPLAFALAAPGEMALSLTPNTKRQARQTVAAALHETLHGLKRPPVADAALAALQGDPLYRESRVVRERLWREGEDESLVAAADAWLARRLRLRDENETLRYLLDQHGGSMPLALLLYARLSQRPPSGSYGAFLAETLPGVPPGQLEAQRQDALKKLLGERDWKRWEARQAAEETPVRESALAVLARWRRDLAAGRLADAYVLSPRALQSRLSLEGYRQALQARLSGVETAALARAGVYRSPEGLPVVAAILRGQNGPGPVVLLTQEEGDWRLDPFAGPD